MQEHQQRVIAESEELQNRLYRLSAFIADSTSAFPKLDALEQTRLIRQRAIMGDYVNVLNERIAAFK